MNYSLILIQCLLICHFIVIHSPRRRPLLRTNVEVITLIRNLPFYYWFHENVFRTLYRQRLHFEMSRNRNLFFLKFFRKKKTSTTKLMISLIWDPFWTFSWLKKVISYPAGHYMIHSACSDSIYLKQNRGFLLPLVVYFVIRNLVVARKKGINNFENAF